MQGIIRCISRILFVISQPGFIYFHDHPFGFIFTHFQTVDTVFQPCFIRRVDKNVHYIFLILKEKIRAAANNDTTGLSCQIQDNILLDIKDHILYVFLVCTKGKHVGKEMIVGAFFRITDLGYREV